MGKRLSVIIPNHNGAGTIGRCLEAAFASRFDDFEVVVVDDCSDDDSVRVIGQFPCRLITLDRRSGSASARNEGARQSSGEVLFFIDADCLLQPDTLSAVDRTITGNEDCVFGGTYTPLPYDRDFFSVFQSVFINYSETKRVEPDYIAGHAMAVKRDLFLRQQGFPEVFLPIIEDVEFSHRLRKAGIKLVMNPEILVTHIFNFTFVKSMRNAFRKSHFWTIYSLKNRDLAKDSGTASIELKVNVVSWVIIVAAGAILLLSRNTGYVMPLGLIALIILLANLVTSRRLLAAMLTTKGAGFACLATLYYTVLYPLAVSAGGLSGLVRYYTAWRGRAF
ncbi:MAG: glycosyltransferase [Thermodesulfovibrionales bacterium]